MRLLSISLAIVFGLAGLANAQEKKASTIKILLPERTYKEPVVTVEGVQTKSTGSTRSFTTPALEVGKTFTYKIEALIDPNNYTKITRSREVTFKAGEEISVDLRVEDKKNDKIVVRWVPTPDDIVDKMAEMAKIGKDDVVFDPGCGDAVMLIRPVKMLNAKKGIGIDYDPKMVEKAKEKAKSEGVADKIVITQGDVTVEKDMAGLKESSVVLVYMGDDLGARMSPLIQSMCKPGTRVVSHRFSLGDWKPDKTITVKGSDGDEYTLHYWVVKEQKK
ncbi:MAG: TIGR03000 domain-containing protein [Planctomycetes bacterium]|nr:TIGR03000 domain-containing protein [Planctomycetota bacterium]